MAAFLAKFVGKKILGERLENKFGKEVSLSSPSTYLDAREVAQTDRLPRIPTLNLYLRPDSMESPAEARLRSAERRCLLGCQSTMPRF
jgi:hypothetical protein